MAALVVAIVECVFLGHKSIHFFSLSFSKATHKKDGSNAPVGHLGAKPVFLKDLIQAIYCQCTVWFSDVFRGQRKGALETNGLSRDIFCAE